jgi:hypothetical protein
MVSNKPSVLGSPASVIDFWNLVSLPPRPTPLFCLFTCAHVWLMAIVCVDDLILIGSSTAALDGLIQSLVVDFPIKDLGPLSFFLGVEVTTFAARLHLSQQGYILDLLHKTNMTISKPISSPMSASTPLRSSMGSLCTLYRNTLGAL